jgi:hypothetical protein
MTRTRGSLIGVIVVATAVVLTGCGPASPSPTPSDSESASPSPTPSESPEPTAPPAAADLALSADGLGTLVFGEVPDAAPETRMIEFDPTICTDERTGWDAGIEEGDEFAGLWLPIPAYKFPGSDYGPWGVGIWDGTLARIDLYDDTVPTDQGIRIGDDRADVIAAYPGAMVIENDLTDIYVIAGDHGRLQIEVARNPDDGVYWEPDQLELVTYIHASRLDIAPFTVVASENIVGICLY